MMELSSGSAVKPNLHFARTERARQRDRQTEREREKEGEKEREREREREREKDKINAFSVPLCSRCCWRAIAYSPCLMGALESTKIKRGKQSFVSTSLDRIMAHVPHSLA